jgi:hypothetical protein
MTEAEWLECTDPTPMLEFLRDIASDRKFRLFAIESVGLVWNWLVHPNSKAAVEARNKVAARAIRLQGSAIGEKS